MGNGLRYFIEESVLEHLRTKFTGEIYPKEIQTVLLDLETLTNILPIHEWAVDSRVEVRSRSESNFTDREYWVREWGERFSEKIRESGFYLGMHIYTPNQIAAMREQTETQTAQAQTSS